MSNSQRSHSGTYFVQGGATAREIARLQIQDGIITSAMGGALAEQPQPSRFREILDIGCGTGGWLIELARAVSPLSLLVGIDINPTMLAYAASQAQAQQVSERIHWQEMDALGTLDFATETFDLVNLRFGSSFVRTWDWLRLLLECRRVCKPSGVIRITDADLRVQSSSAALTEVFDQILEAFYRAGRLFTPQGDSLILQLAPLLERAGLQHVETRVRERRCQAATAEGQAVFTDIDYLLRTIGPFLRKWTRVPDNYDQLCQQALSDMQQQDFVTTSTLLTCWGTKPSAG